MSRNIVLEAAMKRDGERLVAWMKAQREAFIGPPEVPTKRLSRLRRKRRVKFNKTSHGQTWVQAWRDANPKKMEAYYQKRLKRDKLLRAYARKLNLHLREARRQLRGMTYEKLLALTNTPVLRKELREYPLHGVILRKDQPVNNETKFIKKPAVESYMDWLLRTERLEKERELKEYQNKPKWEPKRRMA